MRAYPGPMRAVSMSPTPVSRYTGGGDRAASQNPPSVYPTKSETQLYLELERVKAELEQIRTRSSEQRARSTSTGRRRLRAFDDFEEDISAPICDLTLNDAWQRSSGSDEDPMIKASADAWNPFDGGEVCIDSDDDFLYNAVRPDRDIPVGSLHHDKKRQGRFSKLAGRLRRFLRRSA
ncbi:Uncharacterized protein PBTT_04171 [Plasmodiophora brassicae]